MGDFLNELAAKNLGTEFVIQPRSTSLFESIALHPDVRSLAESESIVGTAPDDGERRESNSVGPPQRAARIADEGRITSSGAELPPTPDPTKTIHAFEAEPVNRRTSPVSRSVEAEHRPDHNLSPPPSPAASATLIDQSKGEKPFEHSTLQTSRAPDLLTTGKIEPKGRDHQRSSEDTQITATPRIVISEERAPVLPASLDPAPKHLGIQPEKPEVRVINVTIGRVEVRALTAPAPTKAARTRSVTLSLDEYLQRRRNGGAR